MSDAPTGREEIPMRRDTTADESATVDADDDDDTTRSIGTITLEPGQRRTRNVEMLVIEAEMVHEGQEPDNPAIPTCERVGEQLLERLEEHPEDLVPAWTRPWEDDE